MTTLVDELNALAKKKRSRPNLEKIQTQLAELSEFAADAERVELAIGQATEILGELVGALDDLSSENIVFPNAGILRETVQNFLDDELPDEGEASIGELIEQAEDYAQEYEDTLDNTDYGADDRDEVWGNLSDALGNIADALTPPKNEKEEQ